MECKERVVLGGGWCESVYCCCYLTASCQPPPLPRWQDGSTIYLKKNLRKKKTTIKPLVTYFTNKENSLLYVWDRESFIQLKEGREVSKTCQRQQSVDFCMNPHSFKNVRMYLESQICLHWINGTVAGVLHGISLCCFVVRTLIAHVCKASLLSLTAQRGSCGARWHDPVIQTHSDSGNRPPEQKSSIISVQQLQPFIECVGVTCPPPCPIDFLWVTNTAHTLHFVSHLTDVRSGIAKLFSTHVCYMAQDMQLYAAIFS